MSAERVWLSSREACEYVGCRSMTGWYSWRKRHAIIGNGRMWARADLDRALKCRRPLKRFSLKEKQKAPAA